MIIWKTFDAPISAGNDAIAEKVKKKASWIFKQKALPVI
jgi:hypothetical protein